MFAFSNSACILIFIVRAMAFVIVLAGCAELGVVSDGTSISVGKPSGGHIVEGARIPDRGEGFFTREVWKTRNNRYGTDELIDLITAVSRRLAPKFDGVRLVIADLSQRGGGEAKLWHRSHQSGRDVDLVYPVRDKEGKPTEPDSMRVFNANLVAVDGSGINVDIPRLWMLVRELLTAPEAPVQWCFMYEPIAAKVIEHAQKLNEPEPLIARARKAMKQPGDSAPHNDHIHVRVYCSAADRAYGCVDIGPMELLAEREAEAGVQQGAIASAMENRSPPPVENAAAEAAIQATATVAPSTPSSSPTGDLRSIQKLLRTGAYRVDLWRWR